MPQPQRGIRIVGPSQPEPATACAGRPQLLEAADRARRACADTTQVPCEAGLQTSHNPVAGEGPAKKKRKAAPALRRAIYHADPWSLYQRPKIEVEFVDCRPVAGCLGSPSADPEQSIAIAKICRIEHDAAVLYLLDRLESSDNVFCSLAVNPGCFVLLNDMLKHNLAAEDEVSLPLPFWSEDGEAIIDHQMPGSGHGPLSAELSARAQQLLFFKRINTNIAKLKRLHIEQEATLHQHDCAITVHHLLKVDAENRVMYVAMEAAGLADVRDSVAEQPLVLSTRTLSLEDIKAMRLWMPTGLITPVYVGN